MRSLTARPSDACFPFGIGARRCIGELLARREAALGGPALAQPSCFASAPGQAIVLRAGVTLRPHGGARLRGRSHRP